MDTGNYQYSQYETTAEYDSRVNSYSSGQHQQQSQNMMSQQSGMYSQQSGMLPQQPGMSQQTGMMSQQTNMMGQQTGMMAQQSGTMSQQPGMMSQQSGMSQQWGTMSHQTSVMPQQSGMMSQQSGMMSQQSGTMSQQSGVMSQQSGVWSSSNSHNMQQSNDMWMAEPPSTMMSGSNNTNYMTNQQRNTGPRYQHDNRRNSANLQNPGYQQRSGAPFQQNNRNMTGMNDPLDDFYTEIGNVAEETDDNFQQQPYPRSNRSGFHQPSDRVLPARGSSDRQRSMGQKPYEVNNQMGTWKSGMNQGSSAKDVTRPFPAQPSYSSTPGPSGAYNKSSEFADEDTEYCKLCNVYFTSASMYAFHVRGLAHAQRLMAVEAGKDRRPAKQPYIVSGKNYTQTVPQEPVNGKKQAGEDSTEMELNAGCYCEVCDIHVNHERILWRHYQGKKHLKALKAVQRGELQPKPAVHGLVDPNIEKAAQLMEGHIPDAEVSSLNFAFDSVPEDEPIVGLVFLVESMENMNQVIECELCKTKGNLYNMVQHVLGLKHRLQYLKVRDRERYDSINKSDKKPVQSEEARLICLELEEIEGRGTARYKGPPRRMPREHERRLLGRGDTPPHAHLLKYKEQQNVMSESEKRVAIEALKRTLLDDFHKRNIDPDIATKILNSRMELLAEYEKRGVPFAVARERVIEEEERWNLLLEFERQVLSFDEAEQRIDHRFELMQMYEKNGFPREEARRKVLDDEVIYDFKRDFVRLGLQREQAQRLAEKRLWMLEHLHYQGLSPEDASKKVITIEQELKKILRCMFEEDRRGRTRDSNTAKWMIAGEELENHVVQSCRELGLSADQTDEQISLALEAFDRYRRHSGIPADEAKGRVLVDDLPIPRQQVERDPDITDAESANDPGSQADITNRVLQFKFKLNAVMQATADSGDDDKETNKEDTAVDQEKQLADYDQQSRVEIQNLLSDMLKMKVPADEARRRLVALYKQHESLRENLFPAKKVSNISGKTTKSSKSEDSKKPEDAPALADDKPSKENQSSEETSATKPSDDSSAAEEMMADNSGKEAGEDTSGEVTQSKTPTEKNDTECPDKNSSGDSAGKSSETKKLTTANDRWSASVEMFLQQYGLSKEEYRSQMNKRRGSGHERYSPSDLSPLRSRSRSPDRRRRSPGGRDSDRGEKRRRSQSRSTSSRWSKMLKSRLRSKSPSEHRRRSRSPGRRVGQRFIDRELDSRWPRRSPGRRSPRRRSPGRRSPRFSPFPRSERSRFSPGRRSPRPRFSPDRRSPPRRRSPFGRRSPLRRRSPGRRSPHSRGHSSERWRPSPVRSWGRPADFSDSRQRPRWNRRESPVKEAEFNFADGVWPDVDDPWD